jgi:hypothetical protein
VLQGEASDPAIVFEDAEKVIADIKQQIQDRFNQDNPNHIALLRKVYEVPRV